MASASLNEISYSIANTLGKDRDHTFIEKVKFDVISMRATLIRRDYERNGISREFVQSLGCIKLICVDSAECCTVKSKKNVLRTEIKVPKPIRTKGDSFHYVGTVDKLFPFQETNFEDLVYTLENRFTGNYPRYAYLNEYVYIFNEPSTNFKYININGIFADPREVANFAECDDSDCYTDDEVFPIAEDMIPIIQTELLNRYRVQQNKVDNEVRISEN